MLLFDPFPKLQSFSFQHLISLLVSYKKTGDSHAKFIFKYKWKLKMLQILCVVVIMANTFKDSL